ncbi:hypothetical protein JTM29_36640, partial [Pseudomonas aeruginosa]|nr:hypothetical protein [Pseudomonas aeruginosa]
RQPDCASVAASSWTYDERSMSSRAAPSAAACYAVWRPMPCAAPVMTTTLSVKRILSPYAAAL